MTPEALHALAPGRRVADAQGDLWQKQDTSWWTHRDGLMTAEALVHVWGPLRLIPEEGIQ